LVQNNTAFSWSLPNMTRRRPEFEPGSAGVEAAQLE